MHDVIAAVICAAVTVSSALPAFAHYSNQGLSLTGGLNADCCAGRVVGVELPKR